MAARNSRNIIDDLKQKKLDIEKLTKKYGITNIRVFGSTVRGQASLSSDVDLLIHVEQDSGISLFDLCKLEEELEQLIGRPIDLVLDDTLHPMISERIKEEARLL